MSSIRTRREPPHFRGVAVARTEPRSPFLVRVTFAGPELEGLDPGLPAASVRLLIPVAGTPDVVLPTWNGNEFLYADGSRPAIRTLTPLRLDPVACELDVEVVRHGRAPLSTWVDTARPGDRVAVAGTGRGYDVDASARSFLVAGDESALPAITTVLAALPDEASVQVIVELRDVAGRIDLPLGAGTTVQWCELTRGAPPGDSLVSAVSSATLDPDVRVWAAGEAAAVQRIRRHLFDERGLGRSQAVVRGYWKYGRAGNGGDD